MNYRLPINIHASDKVVEKHDYIFVSSWRDGF